MEKLIDIKGLSVGFRVQGGTLSAVHDVSFSIGKGEIYALVGESGCGKSTAAYSIMGLHDKETATVTGSIDFKGTELVGLSEREFEKIRGHEIGMIFQNPIDSLNPVYKSGSQVSEAILLDGLTKTEAWNKVIDLYHEVKIPDADKRATSFPHELSGGMRQRVMIACALSCRPKLLIADEPTTALDVTIQAQIMELIVDLNRELDMGVILITHDLSVVAETCTRVAVMYLGQIVEEADVLSLFEHPMHPYTRGLLKSIPAVSDGRREDLYIIEGTVPLLSQIPQGCRFRPRCPYACPACAERMPELEALPSGQTVRCFRARELAEGGLSHA